MSLYKAASIGLSVAQNLQQRQTNQLIKGMVDQQAHAQRERETLAAQKNGLFEFANEMNGAVEAGNLPVALLVAFGFDAWTKRMGVSAASFEGFSDKEFFQRTCVTASGIFADADANLPKESKVDIARLAMIPEQLSCLRTLETWIRIEGGMKGGWLIWNSMGFYQGTILVTTAAAIPILAVSQVFPSMMGGGLMLSLGLGVGAMFNRVRVATRLNQMAHAVGGSISPRSTKGKVRKILQSWREAAAGLGIEENVVTCGDVTAAISRIVSWSESACDRLSIPRRMLQS
jgi:hypothetical protein